MKIFLFGLLGFVIGLVLIFGVAYVVYAKAPEGAPKTSPAEREWFANVKNHRQGRCCDEADGYREGLEYPYASAPEGHTVYLRGWKSTPDKAGEYDVDVLGWWIHVDKDHVIECPDPKTHKPCNPIGMAVVWVMWRWDQSMQNLDKSVPPLGIMCFAPGNLS